MFYYKFTDGTWNDGDFGKNTVSGGTVFICEWDSNTITSEVDEFKYNISNDEVTITKYIGNNNEVVIPDTIEGYPVTKLANDVFTLNNDLEEVTIPKSVVSIDDATFIYSKRETPLIIKGYPGSEAELFVEKFSDSNLKDCYKFVSLIGQISVLISCDDNVLIDSTNDLQVSVNLKNICEYDLSDVFVNISSNLDYLDITLNSIEDWTQNEDGSITGNLEKDNTVTLTLTISSKSNLTENIKLDFEVGANSYDTETYTSSKTIMMTLMTDNTLIANDVFKFKNQKIDYFNCETSLFQCVKDSDGVKCKVKSNENRKNQPVLESGENLIYQISNDDLNKLLDGMDPIVQAYVKKMAKNSWVGSCQGMSTVVSLVKDGYLKLNDLGLDNINELSLPKNDEVVENLINFYQLQQFLPYHKNYSSNLVNINNEYMNLEKVVQETKKVATGGLPVIISYSYIHSDDSSRSHSVVGYDCECVDSKGNIVSEDSEDFEKYRISIYDCSQVSNKDFTHIYICILANIITIGIMMHYLT